MEQNQTWLIVASCGLIYCESYISLLYLTEYIIFKIIPLMYLICVERDMANRAESNETHYGFLASWPQISIGTLSTAISIQLIGPEDLSAELKNDKMVYMPIIHIEVMNNCLHYSWYFLKSRTAIKGILGIYKSICVLLQNSLLAFRFYILMLDWSVINIESCVVKGSKIAKWFCKNM